VRAEFDAGKHLAMEAHPAFGFSSVARNLPRALRVACGHPCPNPAESRRSLAAIRNEARTGTSPPRPPHRRQCRPSTGRRSCALIPGRVVLGCRLASGPVARESRREKIDRFGLGGWWPRPEQAAAGALDHLPADQWPMLAAKWLAAGFDSPLLRQFAELQIPSRDAGPSGENRTGDGQNPSVWRFLTRQGPASLRNSESRGRRWI